MTDAHAQLRALERERWARQAEVLRAWIGALPDVPPRSDALRERLAGRDVPDAAASQMRFDLERDLQRLHAAIDGRTPSAVDPGRPPPSLVAFARDEAAHTLGNAVAFLRRGDVQRAQRWIQRLRWELVDTGVSLEIPIDFSAQVIAEPARRGEFASALADRLTASKARLGHP